MATVILEDIYKRLPTENPMSNERQVLLSKILCKYILLPGRDLISLFLAVIIGCLTVLLAFLVSFMKSNIITVSILSNCAMVDI